MRQALHRVPSRRRSSGRLGQRMALRVCAHPATCLPCVQVLEGVTDGIVAQALPLLHTLVDSIALLDMMGSFATVLGERAEAYVRPVLSESGEPAAQELPSGQFWCRGCALHYPGRRRWCAELCGCRPPLSVRRAAVLQGQRPSCGGGTLCWRY